MSPTVAIPELMAIRSSTGGVRSSAAIRRRIASAARERPRRVIGLSQRRAEHRQHGVADELVQRAFFGEDRVGHLAEALVQELRDRPTAPCAPRGS